MKKKEEDAEQHLAVMSKKLLEDGAKREAAACYNVTRPVWLLSRSRNGQRRFEGVP